MKIDIKELEAKAEVLRAVAHPLRIAILFLLSKKQECNVTEIYSALNIEQAVASHHLRILKTNNVVILRKSGKNAHYSLNETNTKILLKAIEAIGSD